MSTSSFNMREFARKLGLQDISSARIDQNPSTVLIAADLSPLLPALRPPTGLWGGQVQAVAAQFGQVFVQAVDPGGLIIKNLAVFGPGSTFFGFLPAGTAIPGSAVEQADAGVFSEDPDAVVVSRVLENNQVGNFFALASHPSVNIFQQTDAAAASLVIAPGRVFLMETTVVNLAFSYSLLLQSVPVATGP